jgi:hypothetical protein
MTLYLFVVAIGTDYNILMAATRPKRRRVGRAVPTTDRTQQA